MSGKEGICKCQNSILGQKKHILVNNKAPIIIKFAFRGWTLRGSAADPRVPLTLHVGNEWNVVYKQRSIFLLLWRVVGEGYTGYRSSQNTQTHHHGRRRCDIIRKEFKLPACLPTHNTEASHEKNAAKIKKQRLTTKKRSESVDR